MNEDLDLLDDLRRLAAVQQREAGPRVEEKLVAAFRARHPRRSRVWIYAAAAVLVVTSFLLVRRHSAAPEPRAIVYSAPGFVALPYAQSGVPLESIVVIRRRMRPAELSSLGVAVPAAALPAEVTADILVGQDGVPRAVRFVQ
jgi:hypothetical protein